MTLPTSSSELNLQPTDTTSVVLPEENKKVCADCTHLLGVRYNKEQSQSHWKCGHSNNVFNVNDPQGWRDDLVTGLRHRIFKLNPDIYTIRTQHCKGDWWEEYKQPVRTYYEEPTIGGKEVKPLATEEVFTAEALEEQAASAAKRVAELKQKSRAKKLSSTDLDNL